MARIRSIKPKFWDDSKLSKITRDSRLTFIGMWNFADDNGVVSANAIWLKSKIYPYDIIQLTQFEKWLNELVQFGFINLFSYKDSNSGASEEFYYLPNFTKHQVINRPNIDDVFIAKDKLDKALQDSMINHGTITEQSVPERKGGEGKGKEANAASAGEEFLNFTAWLEKNAPRVNKMDSSFTEPEYHNLVKDFPKEFIAGLIVEMHNYKGLLKGNVSANLTFRKWASRRNIQPIQAQQKKQVVI